MAATAIFSRKGYHRTSVADITAAARIARGTFYLYFASKHELFASLLAQLLAELQAAIEPIDLARGPAAALGVLQANLDRVFALLLDDHHRGALLFTAHGADEALDARLAAFYESLRALLERSLRHGQAMGLVRPLDAAATAACLLGSCKETVAQLCTGGRRPDAARRTAALHALLDLSLRGLFSAPYLELLATA